MRLIAGFGGAIGLLTLAASASATTYTFHEDNFTGSSFAGDLVGSFTGSDSNNDGYITAADGEVTAFSATIAGEAVARSRLIGLRYKVGDATISTYPAELVIHAPDFHLSQATDSNGAYTCGSGACSKIYNEDKTAVLSRSSDAIHVEVESAIPEPIGWILMIVGVGLAGGTLRRFGGESRFRSLRRLSAADRAI